MLEIKLTKMLLVLSEEELMKCLIRMPYTLEKAIKRGKSAARAIKEEGRTPAKEVFNNG